MRIVQSLSDVLREKPITVTNCINNEWHAAVILHLKICFNFHCYLVT